MKERYFEMVNEKNCKFWSIETNDEEFELTTRFGRIGNGEQTSVKTFDSLEEMEKKSNSIIKSKIRKGYIEIEQD